MKRTIIKIDEEKCNGCGLCIKGCHEGALQLIDGKARLISALFCDGLGACIGDCPEGAIELEEREAEAYSELETIKRISAKGVNTIIAHLNHLKKHNETSYLTEAIEYLKNNNFKINYMEYEKSKTEDSHHHHHHAGCPGAKTMDFRDSAKNEIKSNSIEEIPSELRQWPVQMHLVNPMASYFKNADVILAADCVAYSIGNFHQKYLKGKTLAIACPKLDHKKEVYVEKLKTMIDEAEINTLTVMIMEVPCCGGLLQMAREAKAFSKRKPELKVLIVGINGEVREGK